jgi:hypothetical protein
MSTGGPAFPVPEVLTAGGQIKTADGAGMTLRDYFAAQALIGLLSKPATGNAVMQNPQQRLAEHAYSYADAMIAARGK